MKSGYELIVVVLGSYPCLLYGVLRTLSQEILRQSFGETLVFPLCLIHSGTPDVDDKQ